MNAHADANFKELEDEFDDIVGKEFNYKKITKEIESKGYKLEKDFYVIEFMNDWLEDVDSEDLYNRSLRFLFDEWCGQQYFTYEINPHFSDWGNVNNKELNSEIKGNLERYLKKN